MDAPVDHLLALALPAAVVLVLVAGHVERRLRLRARRRGPRCIGGRCPDGRCFCGAWE